MLSVIVCTFNRARKLEQCLRHLIHSGDQCAAPWEIIVVDNNSTDTTGEVVRGVSKSARCPVRYVFEAKQGLSRARNRGITEANHRLLAFTDDDCLVDQNWMASILEEFSKDYSLSIVGGKVVLANSEDGPIAIRPYSHRAEVVSIDQLFALMIGCNMALARGVFDKIGLFDPNFGKGAPTGSSEDVDLLYRALKSGLKIAFSPYVLVYHDHGCRSTTSLESLNCEYIRGRGAFYCKHIFRGDKQILKLSYWEVLRLVRNHGSGSDPAGSQVKASKLLRELLAGATYQLRWR
jgi:glycosyltransferase involved in cell wall biosynthesis